HSQDLGCLPMKVRVTMLTCMAVAMTAFVFVVMMLVLMVVLMGMIVIVIMLVFMLMRMIVMLLFWLSGHDHVEFHRAQVRAHDARGLQFVALDGKLSQFGLKVIQAQSEIQQSANRHVAADA